jgi:predicted acyl esterase
MNQGLCSSWLRLWTQSHIFYCLCIAIFTTQSLNSSEACVPQLPEPTLTVTIPMRDGTLLTTDIYHPPEKDKRYPCLLLRNPGGRKAMPWRSYANLVSAGYVVAMQDTRSSTDASGKSLPFLSDGWGEHQDGYDTVEWLAKSELTNGKVGTLGFSACGITQLMLAPSAPPSLCCQYIGVAAASLYHHAIYPSKHLLKNQVEGWLGSYTKDVNAKQSVIHQPDYNSFWQHLDSLAVANKVKAPALHYGGWYDTFLQGTLDSFTARQTQGGEGARGTQKLVIGPWTHYWPRDTQFGDFPMPPNGATAPWDMSPVAWFDYHLKGVATAAKNAPSVTYYTMGPMDGTPSGGNVWRTATHWPVPSEATSWYLGDKTLATEQQTAQGSISYVFHPDQPVPTVGGCNLFLESGPKDQTVIEKRDDVVLFTSKPLTEELELTGRLGARIYYTANHYPCDLAVRFCDVYPDGRSILIADGMTHASPAQGQDTAVAEIDLWSTSMVLAKGHSLRVSISSSNYPRYETTFKTEEGKSIPEVAVSIHHGPKTPSMLTLPHVKPSAPVKDAK